MLKYSRTHLDWSSYALTLPGILSCEGLQKKDGVSHGSCMILEATETPGAGKLHRSIIAGSKRVRRGPQQDSTGYSP